MKTFTAQMRLVSLVGLLVFLWSAAHAQITPSADSYTNTATPTTNNGAKTLLDVDGASQTTYIQFNLASIPTTASISQATLKLYVNSVTTAGSFNVDYVNSAWSESTIDASNAPTPGTTIASNVNVATADKNQYILINVTPAVQAWLTGSETNNGIALVANGTFNATFDSKENTATSHAPELDIAFAGGEGTITGVTTASGSGLTGGGTSGTLDLSLTKACASKQLLQWNGSAWACSNAGTGTITGVTAGTDLSGGGASGNVTLSLNTANVPQLNSANAFSALNTFPNVGIGTGSPLANLDVIGGGGLHILAGDPGCGTFAAIGFQTQALSGCKNYALLGDASGGTYLNASGSSSTIHFRINNNDVMDVVSNGLVGIGTGTPQAMLDAEVPNAQHAGWFENDSDGPDTLVALNDAPSSDDHAYALLAGSPNIAASYGQCWVDIAGNLGCTGSKSAVVPVDGGSRRVALYAVEAPDNWFEDFGSGQLSKGSVRIDLEPTFAQTVNTDLDYHVFLTPRGECEGLYVTNLTPSGFEVRELHQGSSSTAFDYRIIAKRKNYETVRLVDLTRRYKKLEEEFARTRQRRHAAVPAASNPGPALQQNSGINPAQERQTGLMQSAPLAHGSTK
jgi:TGF-beta propeptide